MPTYDYRCESNGQVVEARHGMNEALTTWGELCARTGIDLGSTPADSPIRRLVTGGNVVRSSTLGDAETPPCNTGTCCPGGVCGFN